MHSVEHSDSDPASVAKDRFQMPMAFRIVAKDGKWEVHTSVRPSEGLELQFVAEPIDPAHSCSGEGPGKVIRP